MLVPEIVLYNIVASLFSLVNKDYQDSVDKEDTILMRLLNKDDNCGQLQIGNFNYKEQAKNVFLKSASEARKLQITIGYNLERAHLPTIHIILPSESSDSKGIGYGEGYIPYEVNEVEGTFYKKFTDVYRSSYSLMITSDNANEVVMIYHVLKNLFVSIFEVFEKEGLRDIKFSGQDLQFNNELMPTTIFHRNLSIDFFYETTVLSLQAEDLIRKFNIEKQEIISQNQQL